MPALPVPSGGIQEMERGSSRLVLGLSATACLLGSLPTVADAQGWLADRERTEGAGIRVGDLELHPGIGAELGYDSNVFLSDQDATGSAILRITPHLNLSTLGSQRRGEGDNERSGPPPAIAFRGGLSASYYMFFTDRARDNLEGDLDLNLTINPERPFSFTIFERFGRSIRPFTEAGAADRNYARDTNEVGARLEAGSRGGVVKGRLGYTFGLDLFEGASFDYANSLTHRIDGGFAWRFLPSTALVHEVSVQLVDYPDASAGGTTLLASQQLIQSRVGLNGAFTNKLSLLAMVGYAAGFFSAGDEYSDVIGQLEVRFSLSPNSRLLLGYDRGFQRSLVGGWHRQDRGAAGMQFLLGGSFMIGAEAFVAMHDFGALLDGSGAPLGAGGTSERTDVRVGASLFAEYRFTDWLGANATVSYTGDFTDFEYLRTIGASTLPDPAGYQKFEGWLGVRAFY